MPLTFEAGHRKTTYQLLNINHFEPSEAIQIVRNANEPIPMSCKTKIIIVDDHSRFREGMKFFIEMEGLGEVIAEAENGKIFIDLLESLNPDLVILDIEMPVMGGLEAIRKAMIIRPGIKILVLTLSGGLNNYSSVINSGAMGFVLKSAGKQILEKAIKTLTEGEYYFPERQFWDHK